MKKHKKAYFNIWLGLFLKLLTHHSSLKIIGNQYKNNQYTLLWNRQNANVKRTSNIKY
jgi:hypothetical protein